MATEMKEHTNTIHVNNDTAHMEGCPEKESHTMVVPAADKKVKMYTGRPSHHVHTRITREKFLKHLNTVVHHKMLVMEGCWKVGLYRQGLLHDLSKPQ